MRFNISNDEYHNGDREIKWIDNGIVVDYDTDYTANYDRILNMGDTKTEYVINDFFVLNMKLGCPNFYLQILS